MNIWCSFGRVSNVNDKNEIKIFLELNLLSNTIDYNDDTDMPDLSNTNEDDNDSDIPALRLLDTDTDIDHGDNNDLPILEDVISDENILSHNKESDNEEGDV